MSPDEGARDAVVDVEFLEEVGPGLEQARGGHAVVVQGFRWSGGEGGVGG